MKMKLRMRLEAPNFGRFFIRLGPITSAAPPNLSIGFYRMYFPASYNFEVELRVLIEQGLI